MKTTITKPQVDYGYINARIRAMKSNLFDRSYFENLLAMSDAEQVIAALGKTDYREDIEKGSLKYPGVMGIEEGLKDHLSTTYNKVLKITGGNKEAVKMLNLLLGRWDLHNLRTIVRGKHAGAGEDELKSQLIPAGRLDEVTLNELVKQPDVRACIDLLGNWGIPYARPLRDGYRRYIETKNLADLELSLDRFYYEFALAETKRGLLREASRNVRLVREFFKHEIDFINIMTAIRLVREHLADKLGQVPGQDADDLSPVEKLIRKPSGLEVPPTPGLERYFIRGGAELTVDRLVELAKLAEVEDLVGAVQDTTYSAILNQGLKRYFETGSISIIERLMEDRIIKKTVALFKGDPLSLSLLVAYLWAKFNEVVNLRIILQGKAVGMTDDRIKEALVLV